MWRTLLNLKFWIPIFIMGIGAGFAYEMIKNKPAARKKPNFERGKLVDVIEAAKSSPKIEVRTHDSVREATKDLHPSTADQESTTAQTLKSFDTAGFTLGTDVQVNTLNESYVFFREEKHANLVRKILIHHFHPKNSS